MASRNATAALNDPRRAPERRGQRRHIFVTNSLVGLPVDLLELFDASKPHTFCNMCGAVFQSALDRTALSPDEHIFATLKRREWSHLHSATHTQKQHDLFKQSGRFVTPEAAHKLVPYGIIPLSDQMFDEEVDHAARTAPRMPDLAIVEFYSYNSHAHNKAPVEGGIPTCRFTS